MNNGGSKMEYSNEQQTVEFKGMIVDNNYDIEVLKSSNRSNEKEIEKLNEMVASIEKRMIINEKEKAVIRNSKEKINKITKEIEENTTRIENKEQENIEIDNYIEDMLLGDDKDYQDLKLKIKDMEERIEVYKQANIQAYVDKYTKALEELSAKKENIKKSTIDHAIEVGKEENKQELIDQKEEKITKDIYEKSVAKAVQEDSEYSKYIEEAKDLEDLAKTLTAQGASKDKIDSALDRWIENCHEAALLEDTYRDILKESRDEDLYKEKSLDIKKAQKRATNVFMAKNIIENLTETNMVKNNKELGIMMTMFIGDAFDREKVLYTINMCEENNVILDEKLLKEIFIDNIKLSEEDQKLIEGFELTDEETTENLKLGQKRFNKIIKKRQENAEIKHDKAVDQINEKAEKLVETKKARCEDRTIENPNCESLRIAKEMHDLEDELNERRQNTLDKEKAKAKNKREDVYENIKKNSNVKIVSKDVDLESISREEYNNLCDDIEFVDNKDLKDTIKHNIDGLLVDIDGERVSEEEYKKLVDFYKDNEKQGEKGRIRGKFAKFVHRLKNGYSKETAESIKSVYLQRTELEKLYKQLDNADKEFIITQKHTLDDVIKREESVLNIADVTGNSAHENEELRDAKANLEMAEKIKNLEVEKQKAIYDEVQAAIDEADKKYVKDMDSIDEIRDEIEESLVDELGEVDVKKENTKENEEDVNKETNKENEEDQGNEL